MRRIPRYGPVIDAMATYADRLGFLGGSPAHRATMWTAALYGAALAALPAALQEIFVTPKPTRTMQGRSWSVLGRWLVWAAASAGLLLTLFMVPAVVRQGWQRFSDSGALHSAQGWTEVGWARANLEADELLKQFYLYYYDRRAPLTPRPASAPSPSLDGPQRP